MRRRPSTGKASAALFERVIKPQLGAPRREVLVGPDYGMDCGVVDVGHGRIMALTTDPFFVMPELGWERAAWLAVHIVASDCALSGILPAYCTITLNLPPDLTPDHFEDLWMSVCQACREIDIAIVAGHTGWCDDCRFPVIGSATAIGIGSEHEYLKPLGARPGDALILTKGTAIEAVALLALLCNDHVVENVGTSIADTASDLFSQLSVLPDCRALIQGGLLSGSVTAMHDAAEGGVLGGLHELARATGTGFLVDQRAIHVSTEVRAVCDLFQIDPYSASSSGSLLVTCASGNAPAVLARLAEARIPAWIIGEVMPREYGLRLVREGSERVMDLPPPDGFWPALRSALGTSNEV